MALKTALILCVLLPMGCALGFGVWWTLRTFERQVEMRMQNDLELVGRAIQQPLSHALLREREGSIGQALESAFAMSHVYGAYLYDAEGLKITDAATESGNLERRELRKHMAAGEGHGAYGEVGGRNVYSFFIPLTDSGGRLTGLLQLTRRYSDFEAQFRSIRFRVAFGFLAVMMGLTGTILYGHQRVFGSHLQNLFRSMAIIASGDYRHRCRPSGPRELINLGRHFNRMLDDIDKAENEIAQRREQQRQLEDRLRQSEKLAAIGKLAAGVAHELGTPLSLVDARMQRLLRRQDLNETLVHPLRETRRELRSMERIIRQLLDFSRRHAIQRRTVRVARLVDAAVTSVSSEAEAYDTKIVRSACSDITIRGDPERLQQALINLLQNAIQAAPGGTIWIAWHQKGASLLLTVTDNGHGISAIHLDKIFEPFFTTKAVGEGTGLGLSVVHGIAKDHGGSISVDPNYHKGARFRLVLPRNDQKPSIEWHVALSPRSHEY